MNALTYLKRGQFTLTDKPRPKFIDPRDSIVHVPYANQGLNRIPDGVIKITTAERG